MGANKTISTTVAGPVLSTGGSITVTSSGVIDGALSGIRALFYDITTLSNSGSILGGKPTQGISAGGTGVANNRTIATLLNTGGIGGGEGGPAGGRGGDGVFNTGTISALTNTAGTIFGGRGGSSSVAGGAGGDGVFNRNGATITTLTNSGAIDGGDGVADIAIEEVGGVGGDGVYNAGAISDLFNTGKIEGGEGLEGGTGSAALFNQTGATIATLTNSGTIEADDGVGVWNLGAITDLVNTGTIEGGVTAGYFGDGSTGVLNKKGATITTLTNSGTIDGDDGVGVRNEGTITNLFNTGTIEGADGPGGHAIYTTGSILTAKNSGEIAGAVFIAASGDTFINQAMGVIDGGFTFGSYDSLGNDGKIVGDVKLGAHDSLGNRGDIHGDVTLGSGDTYIDAAGSTVTELFGATEDLYEFSGKYGDVAIRNFAAGSSATHATLQFAADDFSSLTALQNATTQVNGNVVIRLDSTDAITLVNLKLSDLAAVDFKLL